jgi:DNA-binding protein H-NS
MTKNQLSELLAQKAALEQQIADVQREQHSEAVAKVKALMAEYGLTLADIGSSGKAAGAPKKTTGKVAAKFHNPATGDTWSGRGLKPKWLTAALASGRALSEFAV